MKRRLGAYARREERRRRRERPVDLAFTKKIARWLKEKYPSGHEERDGRYVVTFRVADPAWFVREVLQYGAEAEVLGPEGLREAVRSMVW